MSASGTFYDSLQSMFMFYFPHNAFGFVSATPQHVFFALALKIILFF